MIDIKYHEDMYDQLYEQFHKEIRRCEIPITLWIRQTYGGEYIFAPGQRSVIRFENDADAIIFKLKIGI